MAVYLGKWRHTASATIMGKCAKRLSGSGATVLNQRQSLIFEGFRDISDMGWSECFRGFPSIIFRIFWFLDIVRGHIFLPRAL